LNEFFVDRSDAVSEIAAVVAEIRVPSPVRVAVDGIDGAGKSTLADELAASLRSRGREVVRASIDAFHNPSSLRYRRGRDSAEGYFHDSFNYDAFRELLLDPLGPDGSGEYRTAVFDWRTDAPVVTPRKRASDRAILLVDGIFLFRPELLHYWDFRIFVDVSVDVGLKRCASRDGSSADPDTESNRRHAGGQKIYFDECDPIAVADVVVDNNDLIQPRLIWKRPAS
jgi:uridine kinase